jgi:hypothetical protein
VLAFVPAGLSGMAAVNMYYGYYRTWSAVAADFSGGIGSFPALPDLGAGSAARLGAVLGRTVSLRTAAARGITVRLQVPGAEPGEPAGADLPARPRPAARRPDPAVGQASSRPQAPGARL